MDVRHKIPAVHRLLGSDAFTPLVRATPRGLLLEAIQSVQEEVRRSLAGAGVEPPWIEAPEWYAKRVSERLAAVVRPSLRRVVNATGVVLHTNLGRAPLSAAARGAMEVAARGYSNLEYELDKGVRGSRYEHCAALACELTGAEAALVVNNNAAAVVLALNTLAAGRAALVSRGELVEIGGSFRIPEIMARSGARMVEVGATNKTRPADYEAAVGPETGAILKVHRSNFRITGFTEEVSLGDLVRLGRAAGVPVIHDLGSGMLLDPATLGLPPEPTPGDALRAGADLVTFSGDKLLGGPQAGILLGRRELVDRLRRNPLCRAVRVDKITLAALEATLAAYRDPERARREIPVLRMLTLTADEVAARAGPLADRLRLAGIDAELVDGVSTVGGGAYPGVELATTLLRLDAPGVSAHELARQLRLAEPPVVARIVQDRVVLDLRTVLPEEDAAVAEAVRGAAAG